MRAVKSGDSPYENARNKRLQENRKRLQELGITELSNDLSSTVAQSKSPAQPRAYGQKEKVKVQLRRSTRNSGGPQPDYVEVEIDIRRRARFDNTGGTRHYSRLYERKYASDEARERATEKAEAIKKGLTPTNPSFVKPMLQSHVTGGFWLGLPVAFCRDCLPKKDDRVILEDENKEEWETIYLAYKTGLSGGWRGFSLDHDLVDGDALVFELVEPRRFKIHIVRVYGSDTGKEEKLGDEDAQVQAQEAADNRNEKKVRQRLIWENGKGNESCEGNGAHVDDKGCKKRKDRIEKEGHDMLVVKSEEQYNASAYGGLDTNTLVNKEIETNMLVKEEMQANMQVKKEMETNILVKEEVCSYSHLDITRYQQNAQSTTISTKMEMKTGDPTDDDVRNVHLLHSKVKMEEATYESNNSAKDITSYMKAKKQRFDMSGTVKKEMSVW